MTGHSWHPKPSHYYPLVVSPPLALARGSQGTEGAPANHELLNQKFHLQSLIKTVKAKVVHKMMGHSWHLKPFRFFPLAALSSLTLANDF